MYAWDVYGPGSISSYAVNEVASRPMLLIRDGIDLDEIQEHLRGYKNILSIYPQARLPSDSALLEFRFGASDYFGQSATLSDWMTYDNELLYKLDYKTSGRWLSLHIRYQDYKDVVITGLDADIVITGDR